VKGKHGINKWITIDGVRTDGQWGTICNWTYLMEDPIELRSLYDIDIELLQDILYFS